MWTSPFRAAALLTLARAQALGGTRAVCETSFGAGHSALLFLTVAPDARVHSFDGGAAGAARDISALAGSALAAHDKIDQRFPKRLALYVGSGAAAALARLRDFWPSETCALTFIDGSASGADVGAELATLRGIAPTTGNGGHVVALAGAREGSPGLRAWQAAVDAGILAWELTFSEAPGAPEEAASDKLVAGHFLFGHGA